MKMENVRNRDPTNLENSSTSKDSTDKYLTANTVLPLNSPINSPKPSVSTNYGELYNNNSRHSRLYKVIVIGEIGTGKSALIRRYVHNYFNGEFGFNRSTIGVDFSLKILPYTEDLEVRLQLWDIAGQERFSSMTRAYYRGTMGALLVFDHSNANSYEAIQR